MVDCGISGIQSVSSDAKPAEEDGNYAENGEADRPEGKEFREAVERREELKCCGGDDGGRVGERVGGACAVCCRIHELEVVGWGSVRGGGWWAYTAL